MVVTLDDDIIDIFAHGQRHFHSSKVASCGRHVHLMRQHHRLRVKPCGSRGLGLLIDHLEEFRHSRRKSVMEMRTRDDH